jgi:hypothetical protein
MNAAPRANRLRASCMSPISVNSAGAVGASPNSFRWSQA